MVNRRQLLKLSALGTASFAAPLAYSASKITMAYNTGNAIASTSPEDLSDNARNLDYLVNGENASYPDRKGVPRKSWKGMEGEFNADQSDRAEEYAEELVRLNVDIIVAHYAIGTAAAMAATRTIPIVMVHLRQLLSLRILQNGLLTGIIRSGRNWPIRLWAQVWS